MQMHFNYEMFFCKRSRPNDYSNILIKFSVISFDEPVLRTRIDSLQNVKISKN